MAGLVLGVAGAELGSSLVGGAMGGEIGWMVGSFIGDYFFGGQNLPAQKGPRLSDLKFQTSTYGRPIPLTFGSARMAGNVIWATDKQEHEHTRTVSTGGGGKGGGGGGGATQTQTTYTYSISFAVALCQGPIAGVRRLWANGTLIYDVGDTANAEAIISSNQQASGIRFYQGDETQTADSLIESYLGVGSTPAFRGTAYVVFDGLDLTPYGNSVPSIEAEVVAAGSQSYAVRQATYTPGPYTNYALSVDNGVITEWCASFTLAGGGEASWTKRLYTPTAAQISALGGNWFTSLSGTLSLYGNVPVVANASTEWYNFEKNVKLTSSWLQQLFADGGSAVNLFAVENLAYLLYSDPSSSAWSVATFSWDGTTPADSPQGAVLALGIASSHAVRLFCDGTYLWVADMTAGNLTQYDASFTQVDAWTFTPPASAPNGFAVTESLLFLGKNYGYSTELFQLNSDGTSTALAVTDQQTNYGAYIAAAANGVAVIDGEIYSLVPTLSASSPMLGTVVTTIAEAAGMKASDLDVSQLTDSVDGYVVSRRMSARDAITPLMAAYYFDAVESDGVIRFVKRGGSSVATITDDDLGAHEYGSGYQEPVTHTRIDETQLPQETDVIYLSKANNYLQGTQVAQKQKTLSQQKGTLELSLVIDDSKGRQVALVNTYSAWQNRDQYAFATSRKYLHLDPCDIVTVSSGGFSETVRITKSTEESSPGVISFSSVSEDPSIYGSTATGAALPAPAQQATLGGPTLWQPLDLPLLRDQDDAPGFYDAACGYLSGWDGEQLFVSDDGGTTYSTVQNGQILAGVPIGFATTALADKADQRYETFDLANSITVQMVQGTLSSTTRDGIFNSDANTAAIWNSSVGAWEVLQFLNATLVSTGVYKLDTLLRARMGTSYAAPGHAVGETFVLLDARLRRIILSQGQIGVSRKYKPVSVGQTLQATSSQDFSCEGVSQKPLPPVHVGGGRDGSGNIIIKWDRQTRYDATLRDYVGAPLGEASESYDIDVMNGSTVVRTLTATSETVTYTAAEQTTDFGSLQSSITVNVYQKSATVGRGFGAQATV